MPFEKPGAGIDMRRLLALIRRMTDIAPSPQTQRNALKHPQHPGLRRDSDHSEALKSWSFSVSEDKRDIRTDKETRRRAGEMTDVS